MADAIAQAPHPGAVNKSDISAINKLPEEVALRMGGHVFHVQRDRLLTLPESLLYGIGAGVQLEPWDEDFDGDPNIIDVPFDPECFDYVLETLEEADKDLVPVPISQFKAHRAEPESPDMREDAEGDEEDTESVKSLPWLPLSTSEVPTVLKSRPSFIVLREDLEYYVLKNGLTHDRGNRQDQLGTLKEHLGYLLMDGSRQIFDGLHNRNTLDSPEYHLMQMLVLAGLPANQEWAFRDRYSRSSEILSLHMSPVKLPETSDVPEPIYALQKLLLFWRKPAKKCWWDKLTMEGATVHVRRVWTLELCILGLSLQ